MTPDIPSYRRIPLSKGKFAIVDVADFEWLNHWKWSSIPTHNGASYVRRGTNAKGVYRCHLMHREILGLSRGDGIEVDHINRNPLDNRRCNLRIVTRKENCANRRGRERSKNVECTRLESLFPAGTTVNFWRGKWRVKFSRYVDSPSEVETLASML